MIFEFKRKAFHILGLGYILFYWLALGIFKSHQIAMLCLLAVLLFFIVIEFFRLVGKKKIPVFHFLWREKEKDILGGQVYYILGVILAFGLFDFEIAAAVILMTVLGDMSAAIFGIAFGKHWIKQLDDTAWEGVIAEFVVDLAIGYFIIGNWVIVIPMAFVATLVETVFPHVDDNLTVPVFAGFIGQALKLLYI